MTNVVNISVYDLATMSASGYSFIAVYSAPTISGVYTELTGSGTRIALTIGDDFSNEYYQYLHTDSGIADYGYKYKYATTNTASASLTSFITTAFYGNTSDLTEELRYQIEDITYPYRYTIKEMRRFVSNALRNINMTDYYRKAKADKDGIISLRLNEQDIGLIMLQGILEVNKSQLTKAADTNMSFRDGRGNFNVRTHEALRANIRDMVRERDSFIKKLNKDRVTVLEVNMTPTTS